MFLKIAIDYNEEKKKKMRKYFSRTAKKGGKNGNVSGSFIREDSNVSRSNNQSRVEGMSSKILDQSAINPEVSEERASPSLRAPEFHENRVIEENKQEDSKEEEPEYLTNVIWSISKNESLNNDIQDLVDIDIPKSSKPNLPGKPILVMKKLDNKIDQDDFEEVIGPIIEDMKDVAHPDL
jgi:hypothetical protein